MTSSYKSFYFIIIIFVDKLILIAGDFYENNIISKFDNWKSYLNTLFIGSGKP